VRHHRAPTRFRQQQCRQEQQRIGSGGEQADGMAERHGRAEPADEAGKERADAASEIVGEALGRAAHPRRKQLGEERANAAEDAGGEEAEREAERQHGAAPSRRSNPRRSAAPPPTPPGTTRTTSRPPLDAYRPPLPNMRSPCSAMICLALEMEKAT